MDRSIISNAYTIAKVKYKNKSFTFQDLWKELVKKLKLDKDEQKQAGHVYSSMLQDNRFIFTGKNEWKLREYLTVDQQKQYSNALYDFKTEEQEEKRRMSSKQESEEEIFSYQDEEDELMAQANADSLEDEDYDDEEPGDEPSESDEDEEDA